MAEDIVVRLREYHVVRLREYQRMLGGGICSDAANEIERLTALVNQLGEALDGMSCHNCDDRKCMECVFRSPHDRCVDDCHDCVPRERVHSPYTARYVEREAALAAWREARRG